MTKIKNIIVLYPSFEKGGATLNLINFVNECVKKKINTYLNFGYKQKGWLPWET